MITRIEIDGFKSFLDFELDVPPFLALVGPNASGKSNLFDALAFLKAAYADPQDALFEAHRGRPQELFHAVEKGRPVENLSVGVTTCPSGLSAAATPLRHQIQLETRDGRYAFHPPDGPSVDLDERQSDASSSSSLVSREEIAVRRLAREEVGGWRFFLPEPALMRSTAPAGDHRLVTEDGSNLAAVLGRIRHAEAFDDVVIDLVALVPDMRGIITRLDEHRQEWAFDIDFEGEGPVPSTLLSDGTLRVLSILVALHDPASPGVLLLDEIDHGLYPGLLTTLVRRMRQRVVDSRLSQRQVIVTSHSPVVVGELVHDHPESLSFFGTATRADPGNDRVSRYTTARPVRTTGERGTYVSPRQVRQYLDTVRRGES